MFGNREYDSVVTTWDILLDRAELIHEMTCPEYLAMRPPGEKLAKDYAREFHGCPGLTQTEYRKLFEHCENHPELIEKLSYAGVYSESLVIELLESFSLISELKARKVKFPLTPSNRPSGNQLQTFELWRQDDNGHRFLVGSFQSEYEAKLECKNYERKGHKQHYWVCSTGVPYGSISTV